jgi:hypothetical protein
MKHSWQCDLLRELPAHVRRDAYWTRRLQMVKGHEISLHLAILVEPFLQYILDGKKTIESRFSKRPIPPFGSVRRGDAIVLKRSSGPIIAICEVGNAWEYTLNPTIVSELRNRFAQALCAMDPDFWESRSQARFLTLMQIHRVKEIDSLAVQKIDRRGWVVVSPSSRSLPLGT